MRLIDIEEYIEEMIKKGLVPKGWEKFYGWKSIEALVHETD